MLYLRTPILFILAGCLLTFRYIVGIQSNLEIINALVPIRDKGFIPDLRPLFPEITIWYYAAILLVLLILFFIALFTERKRILAAPFD